MFSSWFYVSLLFLSFIGCMISFYFILVSSFLVFVNVIFCFDLRFSNYVNPFLYLLVSYRLKQILNMFIYFIYIINGEREREMYIESRFSYFSSPYFMILMSFFNIFVFILFLFLVFIIYFKIFFFLLDLYTDLFK